MLFVWLVSSIHKVFHLGYFIGSYLVVLSIERKILRKSFVILLLLVDRNISAALMTSYRSLTLKITITTGDIYKLL